MFHQCGLPPQRRGSALGTASGDQGTAALAGPPPNPSRGRQWSRPREHAYLLGGDLACRSLLLASRGSPGLAGSGAGAVALGACAGTGGAAGFFTGFSLIKTEAGSDLAASETCGVLITRGEAGTRPLPAACCFLPTPQGAELSKSL